MASSKFTPNLGLNSWQAEDRPKRMDFVNDNDIIDSQLGTHIKNKDIHVTFADKERYLNPYKVMTYAGNGEESKSLSLDEEYSFAIVFQKHYPMVQYDDSGNAICRFAITGRTFGSSVPGVVFSGNMLVVKQDSQAANGIKNNFNEDMGQYAVVLFR